MRSMLIYANLYVNHTMWTTQNTAQYARTSVKNVSMHNFRAEGQIWNHGYSCNFNLALLFPVEYLSAQ